MIDGLQPYREIRLTDLPWLPTIPVHWEVRRNGRLFAPRRETGFPELPILEVSIGRGVRVRDLGDGGRKQQMTDRAKYQRAVRGDLAYNMMRMWQGAVGVAPADGLVSPAYVVARPYPETSSAYYAYLFRTAAYMREVVVYSRGIVPDRNRLYWESFKQIPSPYPPLDEQRLIVRFLDWHGSQTAKLIGAKRQTIALLDEQKQAIIHHAVTRGLDPKIKLKPSGIPRLGDIPKHWEVVRLGQVIKLTTGFPFKSEGFTSNEGDVRLLRGINIGLGTIRWDSVVRWPEKDYKAYSGYMLSIGDIVLGMDRPLIANGIRVARITHDDIPALVLQRVARIRPSSRLTPEFGFILLQGVGFCRYLTPIFTGISVPHLSPEQIKAFRIPLPAASEQHFIVEHLERETKKLKRSISIAQREIELLLEFRSRLITDVATGKLDIRKLAASLPENVGGPAPLEVEGEVDEFEDSASEDFEPEEAAA